MKKLLGIVLSAAMLLSMAACGSTAASSAASSAAADSTADAATATDAAASDLKVGVITIGDETEGYTAAHINGIKAAAQKLGMSDSQIVWKYKVPEGAECSDAAEDLVGQGCNLVVSNSYGHQTYIVEEAEKYPDVTFVSMTGDFAALTGLDNFKNAFTNVYESRYVAGVVAGMKLQELVESGTLTPETQPNSFTADGKVKIGYVGAYNYAEVVSGYTAFFLGVQSVYPNVAMEVMYTNSWFKSMMDGENPATNWSEGYNEGAVAITDLGPEVAEGTAEKVAEVEAALKDGSLHVFDTSKFTVNGETVTTAPIDLTFYDYSTGTPVAVYQGDTEEAITDGYFSESTLRSAPYFSLRIDGITEDADPVA